MPVKIDSGNASASGEPESMRKIFIGGLTLTTTDEMLRDFFQQWGELVDYVVMRDSLTRRSRGFGFVTFSHSHMVDEAMNNRPHNIDGKTVDSKRAVPREQASKSDNQGPVKRLYVSGIKDEHTEDGLRDYFSQFGAVTDVSIITDSGGSKRGFGFISFDDHDSVDKAVQLKSHMVEGVRCDVKKAMAKNDSSRGPPSRDRMQRDGRSRGGGYGGGGGGGWGGGGYGGGNGGGWGGGGGGYGGNYNGWQGNQGGGYGAPQGYGGYGGAAAGGYGGAAQQGYGAYQQGWGGMGMGGQGQWGQQMQQADAWGQGWNQGQGSWGGYTQAGAGGYQGGGDAQGAAGAYAYGGGAGYGPSA